MMVRSHDGCHICSIPALNETMKQTLLLPLPFKLTVQSNIRMHAKCNQKSLLFNFNESLDCMLLHSVLRS